MVLQKIDFAENSNNNQTQIRFYNAPLRFEQISKNKVTNSIYRTPIEGSADTNYFQLSRTRTQR